MKKGLFTSEFWVVVATLVVAGLVSLKVIPADSQDALVPLITDSLEKIASLVVAISAVVGYIKSRTELKKHEISQNRQEN